MIIFRQKAFGNLQDGYGGKKADIYWLGVKSGGRSATHKNLGPWTVAWGEIAEEEYLDLEDQSKVNRIKKIVEDLKYHPYQGKYSQHPLWDFLDRTHECVVWSAKINEKDRLNYLIFKYSNYILITNISKHKVIGYTYVPDTD